MYFGYINEWKICLTNAFIGISIPLVKLHPKYLDECFYFVNVRACGQSCDWKSNRMAGPWSLSVKQITDNIQYSTMQSQNENALSDYIQLPSLIIPLQISLVLKLESSNVLETKCPPSASRNHNLSLRI